MLRDSPGLLPCSLSQKLVDGFFCPCSYLICDIEGNGGQSRGNDACVVHVARSRDEIRNGVHWRDEVPECANDHGLGPGRGARRPEGVPEFENLCEKSPAKALVAGYLVVQTLLGIAFRVGCGVYSRLSELPQSLNPQKDQKFSWVQALFRT